MSAQLDLSNALFTSVVDLSLTAATTTWVAYDFFLTLPDEIRYMWTRQISVVTVLLFLLRYGTLIRQGFLMCTFLSLDILSNASYVWCNVLNPMNIGLNASLYAVIVVFTSLRIYVISVRRKILKVSLVAVFGMMFVACDAYSYVVSEGTQKPAPYPFSGCWIAGIQTEKTLARRAIVIKVGLICMMLCELLVQILTWERSFSIKRHLHAKGNPQPLLSIILRDGTLVYLLFVVWSIVTSVYTQFKIANMTIPGITIALYRIVFRIRRINYTQTLASDYPVTHPQTQFLDTTQMQIYLSGTADDDAIPGEVMSQTSKC